ncbi:MBL fold metallo-hydrolase [Anaerosinus massiliensis]|uniref:MBL fold metallo-hydrolase n=1 Tax=Massilibacillus massiliensis TaxID=1806837 RepID=UPI000A6F9ECA|nr:MBL fold metallo-hydrolase [Massilibacillus massiliensis]
MINIKVIASSSAGNCYRVEDGQTSLLLEAGLPIKKIQQALYFTVSHIRACLVTHEHKDHAQAVQDIITLGVECYMSEGTAKALGVNDNKVKIISAGEVFNIGTWKVLAFEVNHDCAEPLGYLLLSQVTGERLVFITDSYYVKHKFKDLNYIMVECNYAADIMNQNVIDGLVAESMRSRILRSHFSLDNVKEFLRSNDLSGVKEIHLLHLSDHNSDEERFKKEITAVSGRPVYVAQK